MIKYNTIGVGEWRIMFFVITGSLYQEWVTVLFSVQWWQGSFTLINN